MKYKGIYKILQKRKRSVPGFTYDDRSCWGNNDYTAQLTPLWICAEDRATGCRLWITQTSAAALRISYVRIDEIGKRMGHETHIRCKSRTELAIRLERLFAALDEESAESSWKGAKAA